MVPVGEWAKSRLKNLSATDQVRDVSKVGSGFGKKIANWIDRDLAYPTNVLHLATECGNKEHSAVFPEALPEWFIKLFTKEGDWVLDPFLGSGTTSVVAQRLNRHSIGIELMDAYYQRACERVGKTPASSVTPLINFHATSSHCMISPHTSKQTSTRSIKRALQVWRASTLRKL